MGGVDALLGSMKTSGDARRASVLGSGGMSTSWFGVRGSEKLGAGWSAEFQLDGFFRPDMGASGRFAGDNMFSRNANVAIAGPFGRLQLGRAAAPSFLPQILFNPFGDSFTFAPLIVHAYVPSGPFGARTWAAAVAADSGWSDQLVYTTPPLGGWRTSVHYQAGEQAGVSGNNNLAVSTLYRKGPLGLSAFAQRVRAGNPNRANALVDASMRPVNYALVDQQGAAFAGISYDLVRVKLYGTWQRTVNDAAGAHVMRDRTRSLGFALPAQGGELLFSLADTRRSGPLVGVQRTRRSAALGYDYRLSKRSDIYAVAMHDHITTLPSAVSCGVGIRHRF
jgi:predicted porin